MERIITKSFARLMGRGTHRGFITYEELSKSLEISNQRLNNDKFVKNAKKELIDQEKQNVQNLNSQIESINSTLKSLDN